MFAYCNNNPIMFADSSGNFPWFIIPIIIIPVLLGGCSSNKKTKTQSTTNELPAYPGSANCYAYAMKWEVDPRTGNPFMTKPQPGCFSKEADLQQKDLLGSADIVKSRINTKVAADLATLGLTYKEVQTANHVAKSGNWVVALVVASDGTDYHWYRRNEDGTWSHKRGMDPVIHWDDSGNTITDPANCDRGVYDRFLGYYEVGPN